ncbi:amidohydrolase [Patulibacter defluvii]|uniref:amidohydrolase n=1 Tax=Patulibacter defluvii TaxID=3095358 RepID=UPI002A74DDC9|nr:amidohydrolase [Patulibacter sp. DM4]
MPTAAGAVAPADTVLRNGSVLTVDARDRVAQAVALRDGRIAYVGSDRGVRRYVGRRTKVVDLRGRTAMPGLIDGHAHPLAGGDILDDCDLGNGEATIAELQAAIRACDAASPAKDGDDWLQVSNWNPAGVKPAGTVVSRRDLDAISTTRPIIVSASDGHNDWVNSRALEIAGISDQTPNPPDGEIVRDPDGSARGLLKDGAGSLVSSKIPAKSLDQSVADARRGQQALNAVGVTTAADASAGASTLAPFQALARRGQLSLRLSAFVRIGSDQSPAAAWSYASGLARRYAAPGLTVQGVKFFLDGVIEYPAQTAALLQPYNVQRDGRWVAGEDRGDLYFSRPALAGLVTTFDRHGWRVHMHAIGDRAVRTGLDAVADARRANHSSPRKLNATIAHLQLVDPADYGRFRKLGVFASMQLQWANRDVWTEEALGPFIGSERHRRLYPARSLVRAGAPFAQGSDWPVDALNPWLELETANTRTINPKRGSLYRSRQSIPLRTAIRAHTIGSATQLGLQRRTGSLEVGKAADVIVLDRDLLRVPVTKVSETKVLQTFLGGRSVYRDSKAGRATVRLAASHHEPNGRAHQHDRDREHG